MNTKLTPAPEPDSRPGDGLRVTPASWVVLWMFLAGPPLAPAADVVPPGNSGELRVRILDAETRQPIACTVRLADATGRVLTEGEGFRSGFRCPGGFAKRLPPGPATVVVWHPYLKAPRNEIVQTVTVPASGSLRLPVPVELRRPPMRHGAY